MKFNLGLAAHTYIFLFYTLSTRYFAIDLFFKICLLLNICMNDYRLQVGLLSNQF